MDGEMAATLGQLLDAREAREARQRALLAQYGHPLVSFTLNIAGPVKTGALIERAFDEGLRLIAARCVPMRVEECRAVTGYEALLVVPGDALALKRCSLRIEEADELGRLFDIDVVDTSGDKVSRAAVGSPERRCLLCGEPAHACARSRAHGLEAVVARTRKILHAHFARRTADRAAELATRALLLEVCAAPKPGLVDRLNSGTHRDMNIFTFMQSAAALTPYFRDCSLKGWASVGEACAPPDALLDRLVEPGLRAEEAMLQATGGVNTHKGAIYSLGILCAAFGRIGAAGLDPTPEALCALCGEMARPSVERTLTRIAPETASTAGEKLYALHGLRGVRGEVADGFPSVRSFGLPAFSAARAAGRSLNDAATIALIHLIAHAEDTVLIARAGIEAHARLQTELRRALALNPYPDAAFLTALDRDFTARNLSPGGAADLLAVTLMLASLAESDAGSNVESART